MPEIRVAIDMGGTFIDIVGVCQDTAEVKVLKVLNGGGLIADRIISAIDQIEESLGGKVTDLVLGTTVVTNALLENNVAQTAIITTQGFADTLAMGRMHRRSSYGHRARRAEPLVSREYIYELPERMDHRGNVLKPLEEQNIPDAIEWLRAVEAETVCITLLHSYANPLHESMIAERVREQLGIPVSASVEILPVFREYERMSTTVVNAATIPTIMGFFDSLAGVTVRAEKIYVMSSAGGLLTPAEAKRRPAAMVLSGPAGGVMGAVEVSKLHGYESVLTLDVGGTSADVALIRNGQASYTNERVISGFPVALPSVDIHTVGAGGGSIATLDSTGVLRVGPESARAEPGPICYGRGGTQVTLTDCYVALGFIGENGMLGGTFTLDSAAAVEGVKARLAKDLDTTWMRAAHGVLNVANTTVAGALRKVSVERGYDPRECVLVPFGGAGPLQGLDVARILGIPKIHLPYTPGTFSALGMTDCDISYSAHQTWFADLEDIKWADLANTYEQIAAEITTRVQDDGLSLDLAEVKTNLDLRYKGQSFTVTVAVDLNAKNALEQAAASFHAMHKQLHGYSKPQAQLEVVNLGLSVVWVRSGPPRSERAAALENDAPQPVTHREVWLDEFRATLVPVYNRETFLPGHIIIGPAVIEQYDTTLALKTGDRVTILGNRDAVIDVAIPS